jgi:hypothetical protein
LTKIECVPVVLTPDVLHRHLRYPHTPGASLPFSPSPPAARVVVVLVAVFVCAVAVVAVVAVVVLALVLVLSLLLFVLVDVDDLLILIVLVVLLHVTCVSCDDVYVCVHGVSVSAVRVRACVFHTQYRGLWTI